MKYDVIIKSHEKDYEKIPFVIDSLRFLIPQPEEIHLITKDGYVPIKYNNKVIVHKDEDIFPGFDRNKISHRPDWIFSQFIALFQDVTRRSYYLDVDSDNFFISPVKVFEGNNPVFYMSPQHSHYYEPFFAFSEKLYGFKRLGKDSFITDFMLYNKRITKMMYRGYSSLKEYYDKVCSLINPECLLSDKEIYPNYCLKYYPDKYIIRDINVVLEGRHYPQNYTYDDIVKELNKLRDIKYKALTLHTWTK